MECYLHKILLINQFIRIYFQRYLGIIGKLLQDTQKLPIHIQENSENLCKYKRRDKVFIEKIYTLFQLERCKHVTFGHTLHQ